MFQLNLRQKMLGFFILKLSFFISLGAFLYNDFEKFNEDVTILIQAIRLSNSCLESRRYEKNYFIRGETEDLLTSHKYTHEAINYLAIMQTNMTKPAPPMVEKIATKLQEYLSASQSLKALCTICDDQETKIFNENREKLRTFGKELIALTDEFVIFEQNKLSKFVHHFRIQLFFYILFLSVYTISTPLILFKRLTSDSRIAF